MQDIYERIRSDSNFSDVFKTGFEQTLRQAEIDVIGIDADGKLYMAEVAFHEGGLNYGEKSETKNRVIKKLLRAYLAAVKFFPGHEYEILFASPKVNPATDKIIKEYFEILSECFESPAVHFAYYANDDFRDEILVPTYQQTKAESDTSDLFIRSVRMLDIFSLATVSKTKLVQENSTRTTHQMKIGECASVMVRSSAPEVVYRIGEKAVEAGAFKEKLLQIKQARRTWLYADGRTKTDLWDAGDFNYESNLSNNVHSSNKFRSWKTTGLIKLVLTIQE